MPRSEGETRAMLRVSLREGPRLSEKKGATLSEWLRGERPTLLPGAEDRPVI